MRIGIDFDDTLVDTRSKCEKYFKVWDKRHYFKKLDRMGPNGWELFWTAYWDLIYKEVLFFPGVKDALLNLNAKGHTLVLISSRYGSSSIFAINQIKDQGLPIRDYFFTGKLKSDECIKQEIDLMIDDDDTVLEDLVSHGIKCLKFGKSNRYPSCKNWYAIVDYIDKEQRRQDASN